MEKNRCVYRFSLSLILPLLLVLLDKCHGFSSSSRMPALSILSKQQQKQHQQQLKLHHIHLSRSSKSSSSLLLNMSTEKEGSASTEMENDSSLECVPEDEYCVVDKKTGKLIRLTVQEKERIFLDALQSYYVSGRQLLSDEEFDLLKEDLQWSGSEIAALNRKEAKYLAAVQAYMKGEPMMSDKEFDSLKKELKESNSPFAVSKEPKCYIDTGVCTVTLQEDQFRTNLLYLPSVALLVSIWLGPIFEITAALAFRFNPLIFLLLGSYPIFLASKYITEELLFVNKKVAYGPCPSCEAENRVFFGDILGVKGFDDVATVKCPNCKVEFNVQRDTLRASTLPK